VEALLQVSLLDIRDKILGDAVVFALRLPADAPIDPSRAQGVLVLKAADSALLKRLIEVVNTTQQQNGDIAAVEERKFGGDSYFVRKYPAGTERPAEAYASFADGTFALSNSATLIQGVIERKAARPIGSPDAPASLAEVARFQSLDRQLPEPALARLFIDGRLTERLFKQASQQKPSGDDRRVAMIERWLEALQYAGATFSAKDGRVMLHAAHTFEPRKLEQLLGPAAANAPAVLVAPRLDHVPTTALALVSVQLDLASVYQTITRLVPEPDQPRLANFETALRGIFLGQDLGTRILPGLGPRVLALIDEPADWGAANHRSSNKWPFPTVLAVELGGDRDSGTSFDRSAAQGRPSLAAACENAFRTLLAVLALDDKRAGGKSSVVTREVGGLKISTLDPPISFAYTVDPEGHRLVLGTSASAVEQYILAGSDPQAARRFRQLQAGSFADAHSFVCLDLAAAEAMMRKHRNPLTKMIAERDRRPVEAVAGDLDQFLALAHLLDAAFFALRVDRPAATIHETLGVLTRPGEANAATKP
jgi:hypothetical protein